MSEVISVTVAEEVAALADERESRRSLMAAAAGGDVMAQLMLKAKYDAWIYSPTEREQFVQSRAASTTDLPQ